MEDWKERPIAFACSSDMEIGQLVAASRGYRGSGFILMLKNDGMLVERLLPAYMNAKIRHMEDGMRANSVQMEMLLFVAGTMRLEKAIERAGASDHGNFMVFASERKGIREFAREAGIRIMEEYGLKLDLDIAVDVASAGLVDES